MVQRVVTRTCYFAKLYISLAPPLRCHCCLPRFACSPALTVDILWVIQSILLNLLVVAVCATGEHQTTLFALWLPMAITFSKPNHGLFTQSQGCQASTRVVKLVGQGTIRVDSFVVDSDEINQRLG